MRLIAPLLGTSSPKPLRVFAIVLFVAFFEEALIMVVLAELTSRRNALWEAAVDAVLLTLLLAPALWFLIIRPLQRLSTAKGQLLGQLFSAQDTERARIAADLHDELGQHLTSILVRLRTIEKSANLDDAHQRAGEAARAASEALAQVRRLARGLKPTVLTDLGLTLAAENLVDEFRAAHGTATELECNIPAGQRFPAAVEMSVFRVMQESLTNAARHAQCKSINVSLTATPDRITLQVRDDGRGFSADPASRPSLGLGGMRERIELLGGEFSVRSEPGRGTVVLAQVPPNSGNAPGSTDAWQSVNPTAPAPAHANDPTLFAPPTGPTSST